MTGLESNGAAPPPLLEVHDVVVRFGGLAALAGVSLEVPPASLVGLVGPNGAGKSTLFGVCSGLQRPTSGRVVFAGRDVTSASPQARARLGLARTFQEPQMFLGLTVRQHLSLAYRASKNRSSLWKDMFNGSSLRRPPADEADRVGRLVEMLALTEVVDRPVDELPLGTTRLVEVGRALAARPSLVLLDEPLSGLDAREAARLAAALRRAVLEEHIALLLVEHDVPMVMDLCSRLFVLDFGLRIADGTPEQIRQDRAVKAAYLGEDMEEGASA